MSDTSNTSNTPTYPRTAGWEKRLTNFFRESVSLHHACDWENQNCGKWASQAVELQNGRNAYGAFLEQAQAEHLPSAPAAHRSIKKAGYQDLVDIIRTMFKEKPVAFANRGDLVFVPADGDEFVGLAMEYALGIADPPFFWALGQYSTGKGILRNAVMCFDIEEAP